jgi:hypothetical protein
MNTTANPEILDVEADSDGLEEGWNGSSGMDDRLDSLHRGRG